MKNQSETKQSFSWRETPNPFHSIDAIFPFLSSSQVHAQRVCAQCMLHWFHGSCSEQKLEACPRASIKYPLARYVGTWVWVHRSRQVNRWQASYPGLHMPDDKQHKVLAVHPVPPARALCTGPDPGSGHHLGPSAQVAYRQRSRKFLGAETFPGAFLCFLASVSVETEPCGPFTIIFTQNWDYFSFLI